VTNKSCTGYIDPENGDSVDSYALLASPGHTVTISYTGSDQYSMTLISPDGHPVDSVSSGSSMSIKAGKYGNWCLSLVAFSETFAYSFSTSVEGPSYADLNNNYHDAPDSSEDAYYLGDFSDGGSMNFPNCFVAGNMSDFYDYYSLTLKAGTTLELNGSLLSGNEFYLVIRSPSSYWLAWITPSPDNPSESFTATVEEDGLHIIEVMSAGEGSPYTCDITVRE